MGVFVAGLNPFLSFDEAYHSFTNLFVGQLTAGLSNARAYDAERKRAEALAEIDRAKTSRAAMYAPAWLGRITRSSADGECGGSTCAVGLLPRITCAFAT